MKEVIGIVGIGVMGSAMSGHLMDAGFDVVGYDIDAEKTNRFGSRGGQVAESAAEVASRSSIILFSLPSVAALEEATKSVAGADHEDLIVVEMGTLPLDAKNAAQDRLADAGVEMMDVPVSGTGLQAADATLVVFASGSETAFERTRGVFDVIGRSTHYLGDFGNGSIMKYIANLLVSIHNLATAEAHTLGIAAGLDPAQVQEVMSDGVGSSKIFDIRGPMMVRDEYDPPAARLDIILKDARIIREYARAVGAPTPLLEASIPFYEQSTNAGLGSLDAAALCRYLEKTSGLER
ncbi:MAG: NAD-binding protein [Acidimicrobiia bacterium]|nr:NAD-binding protein [Acidimicrobiia bacterium]